jgi:hypothetical protein
VFIGYFGQRIESGPQATCQDDALHSASFKRKIYHKLYIAKPKAVKYFSGEMGERIKCFSFEEAGIVW